MLKRISFIFLIMVLGCQREEIDPDGIPVALKRLCGTFDSAITPVEESMQKKAPDRWTVFTEFLQKYNECIDGGHAFSVHLISEKALANDWDAFASFVDRREIDDRLLFHLLLGYAADQGQPEVQKLIRENVARRCPDRLKEICPKMIEKKWIR